MTVIKISLPYNTAYVHLIVVTLA